MTCSLLRSRTAVTVVIQGWPLEPQSPLSRRWASPRGRRLWFGHSFSLLPSYRNPFGNITQNKYYVGEKKAPEGLRPECVPAAWACGRAADTLAHAATPDGSRYPG